MARCVKLLLYVQVCKVLVVYVQVCKVVYVQVCKVQVVYVQVCEVLVVCVQMVSSVIAQLSGIGLSITAVVLYTINLFEIDMRWPCEEYHYYRGYGTANPIDTSSNMEKCLEGLGIIMVIINIIIYDLIINTLEHTSCYYYQYYYTLHLTIIFLRFITTLCLTIINTTEKKTM